MWYCMATVPTGGRRRWPVGGSLNYNTVWQLVQFCRKQGKRVEVAYVLPFFSLWNKPDLCPKGIDLGVKLSAPSCPLTFPPCLGLQTEQIESQRTPLRRVAFVSVETQTEIQTALVSVEIPAEIQSAHTEVQTTPVSVWPQTTLVSDHQSKRWDGGQETKRKRKRKTGFSSLSLGSYVQSSQRDWGTATQAVASSGNTHREK